MLDVAREVLALAEQQQTRPTEDDSRGWEFRLSPDRRDFAVWEPGNEPWFVPFRHAPGCFRKDTDVADWQRFVPAKEDS